VGGTSGDISDTRIGGDVDMAASAGADGCARVYDCAAVLVGAKSMLRSSAVRKFA